MPIEYSEYSSLIDILEKSDETTYEEVMKKEKNVLSTIDHVVNHIKDNDIKTDQFINLSISHVIEKLLLLIPLIIKELSAIKSFEDLIKIITKEDRVIYIGIFFIIIALFIFLVDSSSSNI
jgi:hypothetical protein